MFKAPYCLMTKNMTNETKCLKHFMTKNMTNKINKHLMTKIVNDYYIITGIMTKVIFD